MLVAVVPLFVLRPELTALPEKTIDSLGAFEPTFLTFGETTDQVESEFADEIISISNSFNIDAKIIGKVVGSDEKKLTIKSEFGEFNY